MSVNELKKYILKSKYARHNRVLKRRETYGEAVGRVRDMMLTKYPQAADEVRWAYDEVEKETALGSQRAMQFGGTPILVKNERIFNCTSTYADRLRFFQETFFLLLCGCGTGFSVQKHHVAKLPEFSNSRYNEDSFTNRFLASCYRASKTFVVPDTIEGWADALGVLISSYFLGGPFPEYEGVDVVFDFSLIRSKGSPLSSGAGRAPGPEPLKRALIKIQSLLNRCLAAGQARLRPIDVYDIVMHASDAVLAGGVRRSATICVFSPDDYDMATAKIGNWMAENPQRARSNNSALLVRNATSYDVFKELIEYVKHFGEPGVLWADSTEWMTNPCSEVSFWPRLTLNDDEEYRNDVLSGYKGPIGYDDATGHETVSGWQMCVAGDTKLITRDGIENIEDAVGKEIEIWNGEEWSKVIPFETGRDRKLYRVTFGDGSFLDATDNHRFLVADRLNSRYREVQTKDLLSHSKYPLHIPRSNVVYDGCGGKHEEYAYEYGFICGDGNCRIDHSPRSSLFGVKMKLPLRGTRGEIHRKKGCAVEHQNITFTGIDRELSLRVKYHLIPKEIFSWDYDSIIRFVSGLADADGSRQANGFRIYGPEGRMRDLQLLLTKVGINSSVNFMSPEGHKTNKAVRKTAMWYVQIPNPAALRCYRLGITSGSEPKFKGKHQIIRSVRELPGTHTTYCLTEPNKHQCVFNNALTLQCNLTTINGNKVRTPEDFYHACRVAATIGTLQAGFTDFPYLGKITEEIVRKEALLGVSITSVMSNPGVLLDPEVLRKGAQIVLDTNEEIAKLIGINPAARATCMKPEGTGTLMLGSLGCGAHGWPFLKGIKNVQANVDEPIYNWFKQFNPEACERSVWCQNGSTDVISFPIEAPPTAVLESDHTAVEFLGIVKTIYENWVVPGKRPERCTQEWLHHSVSNTVKVQDHEWSDVVRYIYDNRKSFAGISLLPACGDRDYEQAPNIGVYSLEELRSSYGEETVDFVCKYLDELLEAFNGNLFAACRALTNEEYRDSLEYHRA
jgi:ribonucleotide reductase class II